MFVVIEAPLNCSKHITPVAFQKIHENVLASIINENVSAKPRVVV